MSKNVTKMIKFTFLWMGNVTVLFATLRKIVEIVDLQLLRISRALGPLVMKVQKDREGLFSGEDLVTPSSRQK